MSWPISWSSCGVTDSPELSLEPLTFDAIGASTTRAAHGCPRRASLHSTSSKLDCSLIANLSPSSGVWNCRAAQKLGIGTVERQN
eukprot:320552-Chlamydomonas_euryale.AAC.16